MKDLNEIRTEIDAIDQELTRLVERRLKLADEVAAAKCATGKVVSDPARERAILAQVTNLVGPDFARGVRTVYSALFGVSKARQRVRMGRTQPFLEELAKAASAPAFPEQAIIACPGSEGAYTQQAASRMFEVPTILYFNGFENVFEAVEKGVCAYGVLPVENTSAGSVTAVYDLMQRHRFHIVRGVKLKIEHVLLANPGAALGGIREISSHPQALAQCARFLQSHPEIQAVPLGNTATAAQELAKSGRTDAAVIASRACAELYGLEVLSDGIADSTYNYTRFICIARDLEVHPNANKFALMMSLPHRPGSLSDTIAKFSAIGVNLTKIESRPVLGSAFEFRFVFEFEASPANPDVRALLAELSADPEIEHFTFLGAYEER